MQELNTFGILTKIIFGYISLVSLIIGMGLPLFKNHKHFISRPEILVIAAFIFLYDTLGSYRLASSVILLFYISSISISNQRQTYHDLFGIFSPLIISFAETIGILDDPLFDDSVNLNESESEDSFLDNF